MTSSEKSIRLTAGTAELTIDPENGCRISGLRIDGTELLRQGERFGCFPMVPWCGRIENGQFRTGDVVHQMPLNSGAHAIHGTGRDTSWRVARTSGIEPEGRAAATESRAAFTYDLGEPWPYSGRVTQTFELAEGSLILTMGVETYDSSFPAQAGWHPWFRRNLGNGDVHLDFSPAWQEERGENSLPTGRRIEPVPGPWDDCFGMPDGVDVTLTWPGQLRLRVTSREEWVVVYDEQDEAVCVEPQSGPPNGLNTLPRLVTPLEPLEVSAKWSWQRL
ncbi:aldose 1-epimerase [Streptomyces liangshanensis]|uniref:Aldose 1-epimerase n=1 Tax=Streptomyces liangshanensis TaxID=2717324 RepID=A0A6G9GZB3_9ACTN|nr:aldose 1-epimerase [Streptomyces liangshanensis]QIQ03575.1 aldose 1-epimerase [Streptomyces liangshanensis]